VATFDPADLVDRLRLITPALGSSLLLHEAIIEPPILTLTIDGASTLAISLDDADRTLLKSEALTSRSWASVSGVNFELVKPAKSGDTMTLTFEDAIAAALRRERKPHKWAAGSATRREIIAQVCRRAEVRCLVDPDKRPTIKEVVKRGPQNNGWDITGTLASDINWRRFSNGKRLFAGGDEWLLDRAGNPTKIRENVGPWGSLDCDLDVGKRASSMTTTVTADAGVFLPGDVFTVADDYPALAGKWLLSEYRHRLTTEQADVTFVRKAHTLKEPKRSSSGAGETGNQNFLPDVEGDPGKGGDAPSATSSAANPARERMVNFALAQRGDAYVWGGNGPSGWDCSGLVQAATAAGGKALGKPSASQWAACVNAGVTIPVATALRTRGALLFRIGVGDYNHVAISLGNGSTIEAMGSAYGVLVAGNAASRGWTGAALWI
jgi:cell wall-associated NlpC family hydrolase